MSSPQPWVEHPWLMHLGWSLVHFLWQGALVALVLAVVLRGLRRQSAEVRYAAACSAMVLMATLPLFTFAALVHRANISGTDVLERAADPPAARGGGLAGSAFSAGVHAPTRSRTLTAEVVVLANRSLPWLVVVWAIGVSLLLARLVGGWVGVAKARREAAPISNWVIRSRLIAISLRMGIPRTVQLLESAYVTGPAVIGVLRPVVLFPVAALTGLWPIQVEAILAHELAHIRRHDYLVNLIQSLVETLLFYHPAVWWVSKRIRQEREHCCDDMAVQACGNNVFYATALADLDDLRMPAAMQLACAATGGALLPRIRRLVMPPPNQVGNSGFWAGGALAGVLLLSGLAACLAGSDSNAAKGAPHIAGARPVETTPMVSRLPEQLRSDLPLEVRETLACQPAPAELTVDALVPPVDVPRGTTAFALPKPVSESALPAAGPAVLPNDAPQDIAPNLPPAPAEDRTAQAAPPVVVARRQFHRSAANPLVQLPMSIPNEIVAMVRRDLGYWPLGATSIRVSPNGTHHVQIFGKTMSQTASEREWMVQASEAARSAEPDTIDVTGDIRLSVDPGQVYRIPFEVRMHTQPDPHSPGRLATADAQLTWFVPMATHPRQFTNPVPQPAYTQDATPDLMLHPVSACWENVGLSGTITRDNSPAVQLMTRAGAASPNTGTTQGLIQRNAQPLMRENAKTDDKQQH